MLDFAVLIMPNLSLPSPKTLRSLQGLLGLAIALGIVLRLLNLGTYELWYDEVLSVILSTGQKIAYKGPGEIPVLLANYTALLQLPTESGWGDAIRTVKDLLTGIRGDPHPPLSYLTLQGWMRLFGNSDVALRTCVSFISMAAIAAMYGLGRRVLGHRGGLIVAALLATNPFYLSHSLNLRMYGPVVLWTVMSTWAMLVLMGKPRAKTEDGAPPLSPIQHMLWSGLLIGSVTIGLLTHYLFVYWGFVLALLPLVFDRLRWWHHWLRLFVAGLLTLPWAYWGTRFQIRNRSDVLNQIDQDTQFWGTVVQHGQDVAQTVGSHLVIGDWTTSLPTPAIMLAGTAAIALLAVATLELKRQGERQLLLLGGLIGLVPLLMVLMVDVVTHKFTMGFGWGRVVIFSLPGCLFLIGTWIDRAKGRWQGWLASGLLLVYLSVSVGDYSLRDRQMFHTINAWVQQAPETPTLIVMNSDAWGHVLRLARYIDPASPVQLLAQRSPALIDNLDTVLTAQADAFPRLLWLESLAPVWSNAADETERRQIETILANYCQAEAAQSLSGTMKFDQFVMTPYRCSAS